MGARIEYCRHNGECTVNELLLKSEFDTDIRFCLDRCDECYRSPFLIVDGELIVDSSHERILERAQASKSDGET